MAEEPSEPRVGRGAILVDLEREDLDVYGVSELRERIERLRAEADRTEARLKSKEAGKSAADALFKF